MRSICFITHSSAQTRAVAKKLWRGLRPILPFDHACVLALRGQLGAGKTTFMQGLARAMGVKRFMTSPTFLLMRSWEVFDGFPVKVLVHIDSWRVQANDLEHLGIGNALDDPCTLMCIEWAERVKSILPRDTIWVDFKHVSRSTRQIVFHIP